MSGKVVETRIRVGVEAASGEQVAATIGNMTTSAKGAQQAFEAAEAASESLDSGILEANPEAQRQLMALTDTYAKLRQEMSGFSDSVKTTVDNVLTRLERADLMGAATATATPAYNRLPAQAQDQLGSMFQQVNDLSRMGVQGTSTASRPPRAATQKPPRVDRQHRAPGTRRQRS